MRESEWCIFSYRREHWNDWFIFLIVEWRLIEWFLLLSWKCFRLWKRIWFFWWCSCGWRLWLFCLLVFLFGFLHWFLFIVELWRYRGGFWRQGWTFASTFILTCPLFFYQDGHGLHFLILGGRLELIFLPYCKWNELLRYTKILLFRYEVEV